MALLAFLLKPVVELFQWTGRAHPVGHSGRCVTGIVFAGLGWVVTAQVTRLAYDLGHNPQYKEHIEQKLTDLRGVGKAGVLDNFQAIINNVMRALEQDAPPAEHPGKPEVMVKEKASPFTAVLAVLSPLLEPLGVAALEAIPIGYLMVSYGRKCFPHRSFTDA